MIRLLLLAVLLLPAIARAQMVPGQAHDRYLTTTDHVRLHWIEAGPRDAPSIVLVPGWAMPAWIFRRQIAAFSRQYHVAALDPRGQGDSEIAADGYEPGRRGQDIAELIDQLGPRPVVLLGWSLGVLDSLAYVATHGDSRIAGLVLVDNSVGENPPPQPPPRLPRPRHPVPPPPYPQQVAQFVRGMFRTQPDHVWLAQLTEAALRLPEADAKALRAYPVPRTYWRAAVYATNRPVLYIVRPRLAAQAANLAAHHPDAETALFPTAGHALFVDEPDRFDALVLDWIRRRVWSTAR